MPLIVRYVEPQELHKTPLLQGVQPRENELERMSVASLTTLIRQLSSLAKHAESIMGDVADALAVYHARSRALEERIHRLKVDIIPSLSDEAFSELKILPSDCHFQSDKKIDQQVLSIRSATPALQHQYYAADGVPPLDLLLTPLRDDDKRSSQLYSDPSFFFENWRANQLLENTSPRMKLRKHNSSVRGDRESQVRSKVVAKRRSNTIQRQKRQGVGRHQSFGGSDLKMQVERFRSNTGSSSKAAMIKKPEQCHMMLTNLSKVQAEVYICTNPTGEIGSKHSAPSKETSSKEGSYLRRSFSLRKPKANKQLHNGGGTVRGGPGTRGSCLLEAVQTTLIADQDATKMYLGLSQQHLEALRLGSPDIPLTPTISAMVPKRSDETTVTFRAPKATRDRPMSLLLHRWEGRHSPKLNHASKRLQVLSSTGNPVDVSGSSVDLCASSPSLCSSLSSSCAAQEKPNGPAASMPALSKEEMQEKEGSILEVASSSNERYNTCMGFFSSSSSTLSKVGVGSSVLEPYQSGSASCTQSGQPSDRVSSGDTIGDGTIKDAGKVDLVPIEELPRQDWVPLQELPSKDPSITVGLDSLSLLTQDDGQNGTDKKVPNGRPMSVWHDSPLFMESSHQQCNTCAHEAHAKFDKSQVSDIHCINPPHTLAGSGKQTQAVNSLNPLACQSQGVEIRAFKCHDQASETLDLNGHNQSIETLDHKSCNRPFEMLHSLHSQCFESTSIVTHIQDQSSPITLFADSQTPISTPLDQGQPSNTTPFAHSNLSNSISLAIQAEPMEKETTILNSKSATIQPYVQPLNSAMSVLSPPVETAPVLQSSQPGTKMDFPVIPGVDVHTMGYLQHQTEPKTNSLFVGRDAKTVETPLVRKNLLEAIRAGIQLRKVNLEDKIRFTADASLLPWDVAAILERRMALGPGLESDNDSDAADSEWEGEW